MSAPVVPWAKSREERRVTRALRSLSPEDRAVAEAIARGDAERLFPQHVIEQTTARIRDAYKEA